MWERMIEKRNDGGFTLIELLIVIIILAILAAIVVFAVGSTGTNAKTAACNSDAKTVETALESYKAEVGFYPGDGSLNSPSAPGTSVITQGQEWAGAIAPGATNVSPAVAPGNGIFGLLGDNGFSASDASATAPNMTGAGISAGGNWIAPNGQTIGPFLRALPNSTHYQIWTYAGGVYVFPPSTNVTLASQMTNANNFDVTPAICQTAPV
jgi:prepilin-type N-terminal cleavage/methylation domain-containing protein